MNFAAELLWGDRFRWAKLLVGVLAFTGLSWRAHRILSESCPGVEKIRLSPGEFQGKPVSLRPRPVSRGGEGEFEITESQIPIKINFPGHWSEGEWVWVRGTLKGESVEAEAVRRLPHYPLKRLTMYVVSAIVAVAVIVLFFRSGRPLLEKGLFVSRY